MRIYLLLLLPLFILPQAAAEEWCDDFSNIHHTDSAWWGDWDSFAINNSGILQSQANIASESALYHASHAAINAEWDVWIRISGTCSAYNLIRFYIALTDTSTDSDGYYVQIGGSSKNIALYKQLGGNTHPLIIHPARKNILDLDAVYAKIRVTRNADGYFHLYSQIEGIDSTWVEEGKHFANLVTSEYAAVYVKNSKVRGYDFYIDDICARGEEQRTAIDPEEHHDEASIMLSADHLSPNADGWEDEICAQYQVPNSEYKATAAIYTANGVLVKSLLQQSQIDESGNICWDGTTQKGNIADIGIYIMHVELQSTNTSATLRKRFAISLTR